MNKERRRYVRTMSFQFTSPQGDEHKIPLPPQVDRNFNSRLRKETNQKELVLAGISMHFNSRLRKETNFLIDIGLSAAVEFQLTSPRGDEQKLYFSTAE